MTAPDTQQILQETKDVIDDTVGLLEDTGTVIVDASKWTWMRYKPQFAAAIVLGVPIGLAVGYLLGKKRMKSKYQKWAEAEVQVAKETFQDLIALRAQHSQEAKHKEAAEKAEKAEKKEIKKETKKAKGPRTNYRTGATALKAVPPKVEADDEEEETEEDIRRSEAKSVVVQEAYPAGEKKKPRSELTVSTYTDDEVAAIDEATWREEFIYPYENHDDNDREYFDWDTEEDYRRLHSMEPYVITLREYEDNTFGYDHSNLTYFEGDQVLVDEEDRPIGDIQGVMGKDNLERFGAASGHPEVILIRNGGKRAEYEIALSHGKYIEEVLGQESNLNHSANLPEPGSPMPRPRYPSKREKRKNRNRRR